MYLHVYFDSKKIKYILGNQIMFSLSLLFSIFHYFNLSKPFIIYAYYFALFIILS